MCIRDRVRGGRWKKPSEQTAELLAMEARLEKIQQENKKLKANQRGRPRGGANSTNNNNQGEEKGKTSKNRDRPEWMFKAPPDADKDKPKKVNGKTYYWCGAAKVWGTHPAAECRAGKEKHLGKEPRTGDRRIRFSRALQAVAEEGNSSENSE